MTDSSAPFAETPLSRFLNLHVRRLAEAGMLESVSAAAGYSSPEMLMRYARGEARVPIDRVVSIADALRVAPSLLIGMGTAGHWAYLIDLLAAGTSDCRRPPIVSNMVEAGEVDTREENVKDNTLPAAQSITEMSAVEEGFANLNFKVAPSFHLRFCEEALRLNLYNKNFLELIFYKYIKSRDAD